MTTIGVLAARQLVLLQGALLAQDVLRWDLYVVRVNEMTESFDKLVRLHQTYEHTYGVRFNDFREEIRRLIDADAHFVFMTDPLVSDELDNKWTGLVNRIVQPLGIFPHVHASEKSRLMEWVELQSAVRMAIAVQSLRSCRLLLKDVGEYLWQDNLTYACTAVANQMRVITRLAKSPTLNI
jgi:hypothetical protein